MNQNLMIMKTIFQRKTKISSDSLPKMCCWDEDHPEATTDTWGISPYAFKGKDLKAEKKKEEEKELI